MLGDKDAIATIAVKDVKKAGEFYESKLGLKRDPSEEHAVLVFKSGNSKVLVYESEFAGTNKATCATWAVADVKQTVETLNSKGVAFEHYDFPGTTMDGDVHVFGQHKVAWFKDPDGNILSVVNDTQGK